jgi:hypothetical protein
MADGYLGTFITIILLLGFVGMFIPIFQEVIGAPTTSFDTYQAGNFSNITKININDDYDAGVGVRESLGSSVLKSFFWIYTWFPAWLTLIHIVIRIVGVVCIYKLVSPWT